MKIVVLWTEFDGDPTNFGDQKAPCLFPSKEEAQAWIEMLSVDAHDWMMFEIQPDGSTVAITI